MNLKLIYDKICEAAKQADPNIGTNFYGDIYQLNHIQTIKYPAIVVTAGQHSADIDNYFFSFKLNIFYVERLLDNQENKLDIHANGINFLNSLLKHLDDEFIIHNYDIQCFNERFNDMCAGAFATVIFKIPISQCYEIINEDEDYLKDWIMSFRLTRTDMQPAENCAISPYYSVSAGDVITYYNPRQQIVFKAIWVYDNDNNGTFLQWAERAEGTFSFTIPSNKTKFRITMEEDMLNYAYIKKNGVYLFKGKFV